MNVQLFEEAKHSNILSRELMEFLLESMDYSNISFLNSSIEILKILKTRIDRGDKIKDAVSKIIYNPKNFKTFVETNFSTYISSQVFQKMKKTEKVYFKLSSCDGGYNLVMASSNKEKTYCWISSLSERFSLVFMISTSVVYLKDVRKDTYIPFISENGKYCRYDNQLGKIIEI